MQHRDSAADAQLDDAWRLGWLTSLWGAAAFGLLAVTWPLWTPLRDVPRIPSYALFAFVPPSIDFALLVILAGGILLVLARLDPAPPLWALAALALLMAGDQLRWQPWAYHLLLWGVVLSLCRQRGAVHLLRILAISIYAYSAIAKLDSAFASTLGSQFVSALFGVIGVDAAAQPVGVVRTLAIAMPAAEGAVAVLLVFPRTRSYGLWLAIAMHLAAMLALSPLGLGHRPAVLLWNLVFLLQACLLFARDRGPVVEWRAIPLNTATVLIALAVILPLTRPTGWWDRWPSWGLYAPGGEMTEVYVHRRVVEKLPDSLPVAQSDHVVGWRRVELDRWALEECYAPLYPQRRTTIALALWLQANCQLGDFVQVVLSTPADRFTGERAEETLIGAKAIKQYRQRYLLNTRVVLSRP